MLFLFLIHHLFQEGANALPIPSTDASDPGTLPSCLDIRYCRQTSDIVIGCLVTVFACTWVSLHPNVPKPGTSSWGKLGNQVLFAVMALFLPEIIAIMAMNDLTRSRQILADRLYVAPWTIVHCFFVQMDGFYLYGTDGKPIRPLSGEDIVRLAEHRYVPPPQEELEDKSKGDWVSKGLAMVQTLWFIAQCIARRLQHLSITQIEVVTLSYCVINMVVYACWWYKPLSVDLPIRV
ncbi:hypothetical protein FIBSPDRAFT_745779, partial [Athelia psychrophila]